MANHLLAVRSAFSIGESILGHKEGDSLSLGPLVEEAKAVGAASVALMDTMSITGMIDFTKKAKKAGIKPIIGCRLRLVDDPAWRKTKEAKKAPPEYFVFWYVLSERGLQALFKLLSKANSADRFYNVPKLSIEDLFEGLKGLGSADVALATGDVYSVLAHSEARKHVERMVSFLGKGNVFCTLVPVNAPYWDSINRRALDMSRDLDLPCLVSRPVYYGKGQAEAAEVMNAIARNVKVSEPWHNSPYSRDFHPTTEKEMTEAIVAAAKRLSKRGSTSVGKAFIDAVVSNQRLVDMVTYEWSKAPVSLPQMAPDEFAEVVAQCKAGWGKRFASAIFAHKPSEEELRDVYRPRLAYELSVLKKLNFAGYFLLVQDVVNFAKSNGILVGPGRGSVGGSLVAYLMGITDCDPIRFGLLFERFINPDRIDLPDADLDFMSARRHEIVEYLVKKYGQARVAGVSNFGTLAAASALRDVSRVLGLQEGDYRCTKLVPKKHGVPVKLTEAAEAVPEIAEFRGKFPAIWSIADTLEGVLRNLSQHAAGMVVGGADLVERAVIESRKEGENVVCWDKRIVEDQGMVKMDILGLAALDLIQLTLDYIKERHAKKVDLLRIPLDDPKVLEQFAAGRTTGIFQFESGGMRRLLKELGKDGVITFDDITAATALYRPGPMESGMMDSYWKRKQGTELVEYDHPLMEPILAPTYGVMVYQEQVMQVSRTIAGYSAPDADKLRKIMGKKLPEEMKKERGKFIEGCVKTIGCDEEWAGDLFDKIEGFAGYGFNKSHSVEYTLISYQAMWLKTHFPVEFIAAALSLMDEDNLPALLKDADRMGIEVVLPDVNLSTNRFEILTDTKLCIPFSRVKGLSEKTGAAILEARGTTPFASMDDMIARVNKRIVNKGKIEALDRIGAFARIEPTQKPARHPDRIKDQRELIPGLITTTVPIGRELNRDKATLVELVNLVGEYRAAHGPTTEGADGMPVKPTMGKNARFMVVTDAPTGHEEQSGAISFGKSFDYIADALSATELARHDAYWTSLIKRPKSGKQVSPEEIKTYLPYFQREVELLKPPIIVLLGSIVVRHFFPELKGKASEHAGTIVYVPALDANVVLGFNPAEIYHDPDKQAKLNEVFAAVVTLLS